MNKGRSLMALRCIHGIPLVLLASALCSCVVVSYNKPTEKAKPISTNQVIDNRYLTKTSASSEVIIKRDGGFAGSACSIRVFIDESAIADLWPEEKVVLYVPHGEHLFGAERNGICGLATLRTDIKETVTSDKSLVLRIGIKREYFIGSHCIFITTDEF
jgi:hypothetical protein